MATKKKMLQAAAGQAGGAGLDITEVFSTYLYDGNGATQTITNDIDLAGEGGLVWQKIRTGTYSHSFVDTERGGQNTLQSNGTDAQVDRGSDFITSFNSDGFSIGADALINQNGQDYASWTFRKAPKFFDVVTYTGDGTNGRSISHNLGSAPGMMLIKKTSSADDWRVFHRSQPNKYAAINSTFQFQTDGGNIFGNPSNGTATAPTSTHFTVANDASVNQSGGTYVAYVFAHNDGDGGFGPDGDQDIIKCGSYSQSSASDVDVDLGFEPQFVIVKRSDDVSQWYVLDEMRGFLAGSNSTSSRTLYANLSNAEADFTIQKTATGFTWPSGQYGSGTQQYIYMAIRRGPLAQPESGTEVFAPVLGDGNTPGITTNFPVDFAILKENKTNTSNIKASSRLTGPEYLLTHATNAGNNDSSHSFDHMDGWFSTALTTNAISWSWKRAPGFFDVVAYSGTGTERGVPHNLGVTPEMLIIKARDFAGKEWFVHHTGLTSWAKVLQLQSTAAEINGDTGGNLPTATTFPVNASSNVNGSGYNYIAYLFASLPGISKVGSFSHSNGSNTTVDCGFTSGARFVLVKQTDLADNWFVFDTERGITVSDSPRLFLNTTSAEFGASYIEPTSSGFIIKNGFWSAGDYIFYAIA